MRILRDLKLLATGVVGALVILGLAPAGASSANISHSYSSDKSISIGSLVSLDSNQPDFIKPANSGNADQLLGIVVASNDSLLAVDAQAGSAQVATSGTASALVSDLNGDIRVGDQIAVSPFDGVGVRATPGTHVIGLAQTAFRGKEDGVTTQTVTDKTGKTHQTAIGYVRLNIGIGTASSQSANDKLSAVQRLVKSVTGHTVSTLRAIISIAVAIVAGVALVTLVYASIYSSIISIGRNPLAKFAVFRTLTSVLGMATLVAAVAMLTIFLLLR